ncbi:MAG: helix-turn-helix domain-containing protein [Solirubrobacteraceae bacterium]
MVDEQHRRELIRAPARAGQHAGNRDPRLPLSLEFDHRTGAERLNGLVEEGLLERTPDPHHAGRHQYALTAIGKDLWPALHALMSWGDRHRATNSRIFKHAACGTRLDDEGKCPRCDLTPAPEEIITEPHPDRRTGRDDPVAVALRAPHRLLALLDT